MKALHDPGPATIAWEGDAKEILSDFPDEVKATLGFSLRQIQNGRLPIAPIAPCLLSARESGS
jgi:hypothetical protein